MSKKPINKTTKKVTIKGSSDIEYIGGNKCINVPRAAQLKNEHPEDSEVRVENSKQISIVMGDQIENILEQDLLPNLEPDKVEEMQQLVVQLQQEIKQQSPNESRIKELLNTLMTVTQLAQLAGPAVESIKNAIVLLANQVGINL